MGWEYLALAFDGDAPINDDHLGAFDRFIRVTVGELIVGLAPLAAEAVTARLPSNRARPHGISDPRDDELGDLLN